MSVQEYYAEFRQCICCGIVEDIEDEIIHFYGGLRHEIQDIVFHIKFYTVNRFFQLAMLAEKDLLGCQQKNQSNISDIINQVLARVEQAFTKIETAICRFVVASVTVAASSPPPPTPTFEHGKILNPAEIVQLHRESACTENKEIDIKNKNHQVLELKDSFMLATKSDITRIGDDVLNLSTTHTIIEQYLVDTKSEFPLSQNNCSDSACDKEELFDNAFITPMPQLVNEHDAFVLEPNTCAENKNLLPIAAEKYELKLLSSLDTLDYIEFDILSALSTLEEKFKYADCHGYLDVHIILLAKIIVKESIWCIMSILVQI
jgi:hypothetical protein